MATSRETKEEGDKVAFYPLVREFHETRVYGGCANVETPGVVDLSNPDSVGELLKARTVNPLIAKGVDPLYEESDTGFFGFAHGKSDDKKLKPGMVVGLVNYFGGLGYVVKCNLRLMRGMPLDRGDEIMKNQAMERARRLYWELMSDLFVEDISGLGLRGIKTLEAKYRVKIRLDKLIYYPIVSQMEHVMKNPTAGEFNALVAGERREVESFLERFKTLNIPSYLAGVVLGQ